MTKFVKRIIKLMKKYKLHDVITYDYNFDSKNMYKFKRIYKCIFIEIWRDTTRVETYAYEVK